MLRITIELVPHGNESRKSVLGVCEIANTGDSADAGSEDSRVGNYLAAISKFGGRGLWKRGRIVGFPRKKLGPWDLLYRALVACGIDQRNQPGGSGYEQGRISG